MFDYYKAFDSMDQSMLISKMHYYGFGGDALTPLAKLRDIPQGCCLGSVLYTLYTADIPSSVQNCTLCLCADDSQFHFSYGPTAPYNLMQTLKSEEAVCDKAKILGVVIDCELTPSLNMPHMPPKTDKLNLVKPLIPSVFYYCSLHMGIAFLWRIWIQNYLRRFDLVSPYRETVNMLSRMLTCYLTYSILLIREPDYLYQRLSSRDEVSQGTSCDGKRL
ncbi:hypothetical protein J6590_052394 [Homalodisca vitripennis]|nr:hypothetical protein J6590_052394 [Homalodisca vitripennis]